MKDSAQDILDTTLDMALISRVDHAVYPGRELMKAKLAISMEPRFSQDDDFYLPFTNSMIKTDMAYIGESAKARTACASYLLILCPQPVVAFAYTCKFSEKAASEQYSSSSPIDVSFSKLPYPSPS